MNKETHLVNTNEITTRGPQPVKTVVDVERALGEAAEVEGRERE